MHVKCIISCTYVEICTYICMYMYHQSRINKNVILARTCLKYASANAKI